MKLPDYKNVTKLVIGSAARNLKTPAPSTQTAYCHS